MEICGIMHRCSRSIALVSGVAILALFSLNNWIGGFPFAGTIAQSPAKLKPIIVYNIPYTKAVDVETARRQSLDLYLPGGTKFKPPLVIFIHGGFWTLSDDDYGIGPSLADALLPSGIAVALVRYRLGPTYRHPAQAQDVAAAVAHLMREADRYGYDAKRIFLAGHSAGAHLAALVALDVTYLSAHRISPQSLAGVIALSGIYDLAPKTEISENQKSATEQAFGNNPATVKEASPITHVRVHAPPFLVLTASSDFPGFLVDARKFADALRGAGHPHVEQYVIPDRDHFSLLQLTGGHNEVRSLFLAFLKAQPLPPELSVLIVAKRRWVDPPFSSIPFWRDEKLVRSYPIDKRFVQKLLPIYDTMKYELLEWPLESYYAIDLFSFLDSLPQQQVGRGNYLVITNLRNEKLFWNRQQVEPYKPVIVIGMDHERNLFRLGVFYRALREYSWKPGPRPPMMARPLGAFIHFLNEPGPELQPQSSHYALTTNSFRLVDEDPLALLSNVPKDLHDVLTYRNGCVYCHSFRGIGSRSHHALASTGAPHGGFALPLETYPPQVWKAFVFHQHEVAAKIGASPNVVDKNTRQALYDLVVESRERRHTPRK